MSPLVRQVLYAGEYEAAELEALRKFLSRDDVVLELGTVIGLLAIFCARIVGAEHVHSYEANERNKFCIYENFALNGVFPNVHFAMPSNGVGERAFYVADDLWGSSIHFSPSADCVRVPTVSLNDEIRRTRPMLLIVDVEGAELEIAQLIDYHTIRKIVVEVHPELIGHEQTTVINQLFESGGFRLVWQSEWQRHAVYSRE